MKKFLSLLLAVLTISLTASAQEQATVRVQIPSDCSMDFSNGLWLAWFDGYYEDSSNTTFVPMTPETEGGRIFTASFTPTLEYGYFGYYFINAASAEGEGYQRTYSQTYLSDLNTTCYDVRDEDGYWYNVSQVYDCTLADHNYKPYNLVATPLGRDSVLFEWSVAEGVYYGFSISYHQENGSSDGTWAEADERSLRVKLNRAEQTVYDYWTVSANTSSGYYPARGEGFTIAGDDRIPTHLTISADGNQQYTLRWDAGQSVDHFYVTVGDQQYDNVTARQLQVTLADNEYYYIYVYSRDAENHDIGSLNTSVSTYTQESRDLVLHFYIPEARGFIGANGAAILWRDAEFTGDHIVPLVADGEDAPHWYTATVAGFNREYIHYYLLNATTAESATKTVDGGSFGRYGSTETYLILGVDDAGQFSLDGYGSYYPHDYAASNLQLTQVMNKLVFTWESSEAARYYVVACDEAGNYIINGYTYSEEGNRYEYTSDNAQPYVISKWSVTPYINWGTVNSMRVENTTPFTVQPSPFTPKNLQAQDNGDGTWTFSWDAIALDTVQQYSVEVRDAGNNTVYNRYNMRETSITDQVNFLFSGRCSMRVSACNNWGSTLGSAVDSFTIAPVAAHDINIRVLINPMSGYDTSAGVQFDIQSSADGGFAAVDAIDDHYGWWKYTLHTTERGANVRLHDTWRNFTAYGDTCVSYTGYYEAEDCDAHANDYMPQNLLAQDNGDGTWTLSWSMDYTERVYQYYVQVNDSNGNEVCSDNVRNALQWKTPVIASTGRYTFSVRVYNNNYNTLGYAEGGSFTVSPKQERDIELRVLVQPGAQDGWGAYTYNADDYDWTTPVVFTEAAGGWLTHTFTTTDPAVNVRFKQNAYYYYGTDFAIADNTCIEYESEFQVVDCDKAHLQNFTLSNLQVANLGNGKFHFSWNCEDNPDRFEIRVCMADSSTIVWNNQVGGNEREITTRLNNDSTMELVWYVVPVKRIDYSNTYLWDKRAYGQKFTAEASAYIPQNVTATLNGDGRWTIKWNALPAAVARYQVALTYPNYNTDNLYPNMGDTTCTTQILTQIGNYTAVVYALDNNYETLGQASVNFTVSEVAERALNVRVLLHPDAERSIQSMNCETGNGTWDYTDPVDEGNGWYRFTFRSTMPAPQVQLFGYQATVFGDTCLQYTWSNLSSSACDAVAHDYRIKPGSLNAVSEAGRVTFSWGAVEKSQYYELQLKKYNSNYDYWDTFEWMQVTDTFAVYLVPDDRDGQEIRWNVRAALPHNLNTVEAAEAVTLHKSQIVLSNLKATTTDSIHYNLSWSSNNNGVKYQLQVRISGGGLVDTQLDAKQYDFTAITGYGSYSWQVRAVNAQGEPLTTWTQAESFDAKKLLRIVSNLQGSATERTLHFSWTTSSPRVAVELWREESGWGRTPMFPRGDSIISGNTFDFVTTEDGRYIFQVYGIVETAPDSYYTIYEENIAYVNIFTQAQTYHVSASTTVGGSFYGVDPSGDYPNGYQLRLCPSSTGYYRFVRWSDGNDNECRMITVTQDTTLIALYEPLTEQHIVIAAENGRIRNVYQNDTVARIDTTVLWGYNDYIEIIPNDGYELYEWSDGYDRTNTHRSLSFNSDTAITAVCKPICYVSVAAGEGGRIQVTGAGEYNRANKTYRCSYGSEITIKANPNEGYRFLRWSDGNVNVTRNIVVTENLNLTAQFQEVGTPLERFVVRILSSDTELGEVNQVSGNYYDGDQVTLIATPKAHAIFTGWSDGVADATRILTVSSDTTITAQFDHKRVTVAISAGEGGSVNTEVNGTYNYGEQITITATPAEGYHFVRWSDGETAAVRYITLTEDITLTAVFAQETYLVTFLNADGSFIEANSYLYGEMPACSVTPTLASTEEWIYTFTGWSPALTAVTANAVYTAVYDREPNPGQGIDNTDVRPQATKILRNGQIFILIGDKMYTIQGQLVK